MEDRNKEQINKDEMREKFLNNTKIALNIINKYKNKENTKKDNENREEER